MIDIAPILTTPAIVKIKKVIRDDQKPPEQRQSQQNEQNEENKEDKSTETGSQHIDEIV